MSRYRIAWGDMHHNTYQHHVQDPPLDEVLAFASTHLDFYTGAYYTPVYDMVAPDPTAITRMEAQRGHSPTGGHLAEQKTAGSSYRGVHLEHIKDPEAMSREWAEFQVVTASRNEPGRFITLPGYEWQGNGRYGDHNVIYRQEGPPIYAVETLPELYQALRGQQAIAIPHHTGYHVGQRAPTWANCDETISPFAELYSIHGCSETDEEWIGLRHNPHMGPGVGGGTYQEALDQGLHLGAICSTDNWTNMPGHWNQGVAAALVTDLTRDGLWEAFKARRVYGVSGDRMALDFTCNGAPMGSILAHTPRRQLRVQVSGLAALDRIELLRNGQVIATHCHQGTWRLPKPGQRTPWALRIEAGWGPSPNQLPMPDVHWQGQLSVAGGRMTGWSPAWVTRGQSVPALNGDTARFGMVSRQSQIGQPAQGATILQFEATPEAEVVLQLNGQTLRCSLVELAQRSHLLWYRDKCVEMIRQLTGVTPETAQRGDIYYHLANKAKLHRAVPEAGFATTWEIIDDEPLIGESHYRVRVEQRNGQRAWSSPIWVQAAPA